MKALILAAGYGTRLGRGIPKHLIKIADKEMIIRLLEKIELLEQVDMVYVITNAVGFENTQATLSRHKFSKKIKLLNDGTKTNDKRLGSVGDILFVLKKEKIDDDLLIVAGDNLFEFNMADFIRFFNSGKEASIVLYDVKDYEIAKRLGIAKIDANNKIIHFIEKPENPPSTLAGTFCYLLRRDTLKFFYEYEHLGSNLDKIGNFTEYLYKIKPVYGWVTEKIWFDIGDREQFSKADNYFKSVERRD